MAYKIPPDALVPMDLFAGEFPLRIDLAYARDDNLLLGEAIYDKSARLWLHEDLAALVLLAAHLCHRDHGLHFVLYDGLRTVEAQARMMETGRVKDNPQWLEEPRLLSRPGTGGHPRGMAIDLALETPDGDLPDMGTAFDFLAQNAGPAQNPAHRAYTGHSEDIMKNRGKLDRAMIKAAQVLNVPLVCLPQEWWDFRIDSKISDTFAPLREKDLPPQMQITGRYETNFSDLPDTHFEALKKRICETTDNYLRKMP